MTRGWSGAGRASSSRCARRAGVDFVPLAGPRGEVAHGDGQPGLGGQVGQFGLPGARSVTVGAAAVGADQQPGRPRVGVLADRVPPGPDRVDRERGGVVVGADGRSSRCRWTRRRRRTGWPCPARDRGSRGPSPVAIAARAPFPPAVLVVTDELLLLGVHADHSLSVAGVRGGLLVEVAELPVPVRVIATFELFGVALQAEPLARNTLPTVSALTGSSLACSSAR